MQNEKAAFMAPWHLNNCGLPFPCHDNELSRWWWLILWSILLVIHKFKWYVIFGDAKTRLIIIWTYTKKINLSRNLFGLVNFKTWHSMQCVSLLHLVDCCNFERCFQKAIAMGILNFVKSKPLSDNHLVAKAKVMVLIKLSK